MTIRLTDPNTDQWHALRRQSIGASEAAAACGMSRYATPLDIYFRKRGEIPDTEENDLMWFGSAVEPVIAQGFTRETGIAVRQSPFGMFRSSEHPWMTATPDADIDDESLGEWKSLDPHYARLLGVKEGRQLPKECIEYHCQSQHQLAVMERSRVHFGILIGRKVIPFVVERNDRMITAMVKLERELWQMIEAGTPPEPDWQHDRTRALLAELYAKVEPTRINLSAEGCEFFRQAEAAKAEIKRLEAEAETAMNHVRAEIGEHGAGLLDDGKREVRRIAIKECEISYTRKAHVQFRACNAQGPATHLSAATALEGVLDQETEQEIDLSDRFLTADARLRSEGFTRYEQHEGSSYYIHSQNPVRVRVSDHAPNYATSEWMRRQDVWSVRVDSDDFEDVLNLIDGRGPATTERATA